MSVSCLVASPLTTALFNRAIAESGSLLTANPYFSAVSLSNAEEKGIKMTDKGGLHTITEMRNLSAEDVMKLFPGLYAPVIDGYVLPEPIADIFSKNKQNHVPLIIGWNADEGIGTSSKKKEEYKTQAEKRYGADAAQFLTYFPGESDEQAARSETEFSRNQIFALSGYKWAGIQSQYTNSPVYVYNFNRKVPATGSFVQYGAFHTAEVPYAMDNLKFLKNRPLEESDTKLAGLMSEYWINFIKSGNPNSRGLTDWPKYDTTNSLVKVFDTITQTEKLPDKGGLDFMLLRSDN